MTLQTKYKKSKMVAEVTLQIGGEKIDPKGPRARAHGPDEQHGCHGRWRRRRVS